jgi:hypothetical protein
MKKAFLYCIFSLAIVCFSVCLASAQSIYFALQGDTPTGDDIATQIISGMNYTFDAYFNISAADAGTGIFGVGIDINYNPSIFNLSGTPTIDALWNGTSTVALPVQTGSNVLGDDFGYNVSTDTLGISGELLIGSFVLEAIDNANSGEWLITSQEFGPDSEDSITYDFVVLDDLISYKGVNAVPIPSTILLLGGGLAALVGLRRRKSS